MWLVWHHVQSARKTVSNFQCICVLPSVNYSSFEISIKRSHGHPNDRETASASMLSMCLKDREKMQREYNENNRGAASWKRIRTPTSATMTSLPTTARSWWYRNQSSSRNTAIKMHVLNSVRTVLFSCRNVCRRYRTRDSLLYNHCFRSSSQLCRE